MRTFGRHDQYQAEDVPFAAGGFGRLYRCSAGRLIYKEYKKPLQDPLKITQLERICALGREVIVTRAQAPGETPESSVNWPIDIVGPAPGPVLGVILPTIPQRFFQGGKERTLDHLLLARANPPRAAVRLAVLIRLAEILAWLNGKQLVHGDVAVKNVVWCERPQPGAYLIDCDGLQPQLPPPRDGVKTPGWIDPRLVEGRIPAHDQYSDWYALALAMYRGLLLNKGILDRRNGVWPGPKGLPGDLDPAVRKLLQRSLGLPLDASARAAPAEWVTVLRAAYISNGAYDARKLAVLDRHADEYRSQHTRPMRPVPRAQPAPVFTPLPPQPSPGPVWTPAPAPVPSPVGFGGPPPPPVPHPGYRYRPGGLGGPGKLLAVAAVALLLVLAVGQLAGGPESGVSAGGTRGGGGSDSPATTDAPPGSGGGVWVAQMASVPYAAGIAKRNAIARAIGRQVPGSRVLRSDDFRSLKAGYWVVYHPGPFASGMEALDLCEQHGRTGKDECLGRFLSDRKADFRRMCFRKPDGTPTDACST